MAEMYERQKDEFELLRDADNRAKAARQQHDATPPADAAGDSTAESASQPAVEIPGPDTGSEEL
jgi:hypothetical protein